MKKTLNKAMLQDDKIDRGLYEALERQYAGQETAFAGAGEEIYSSDQALLWRETFASRMKAAAHQRMLANDKIRSIGALDAG